MIVSSHIFEAYLKCPSKCWLVFLGEKGEGNIYLDFIKIKDVSYRTLGLEKLMAKGRGSEYCGGLPPEPLNIKSGSWVLARNIFAKKDNLESRLHAVERLPSDSPGQHFSRLEPDDFASSNLDDLSGFRITAFSSIPINYIECTEPNQCHFIPCRYSIFN